DGDASGFDLAQVADQRAGLGAVEVIQAALKLTLAQGFDKGVIAAQRLEFTDERLHEALLLVTDGGLATAVAIPVSVSGRVVVLSRGLAVPVALLLRRRVMAVAAVVAGRHVLRD